MRSKTLQGQNLKNLRGLSSKNLRYFLYIKHKIYSFSLNLTQKNAQITKLLRNPSPVKKGEIQETGRLTLILIFW